MIAERICQKIACLRIGERSQNCHCAAELEYRNSFAGRAGKFYVVQFYRRQRGVKVCNGAMAFDSEAAARAWFNSQND